MFVPIKPFGQLLVISSKNIIILKLLDPNFQVNITLVIN